MIDEAQQGHRYLWNGLQVLAMEGGAYPLIQAITNTYGWPLRHIGRVNASSLMALPMVYFQGQVPE